MKHTKSYIICATPRSGSTLLCDLLTDTGVAGCPHSFFGHQDISWYADNLNVSAATWDDEGEFDQSYLAAVQRAGLGGTRVFGLRLMWESVGNLSRRLDSLYPGLASDSARFRTAFGPPLYVHLSRQDKVAQAVSLLKAEQSGLWHVAADGSERERVKPGQTPVYDGCGLADQVAALESHDGAWARWFAGQGIEPLPITYEALSTEPLAVLASLLSALGLDPALAATVGPRTTKLADRESREWAARFRTERLATETAGR